MLKHLRAKQTVMLRGFDRGEVGVDTESFGVGKTYIYDVLPKEKRSVPKDTNKERTTTRHQV